MSITAVLLIGFSSCSEENIYDINGFVKQINQTSQSEISADDFTVTIGERTVYTYMFNSHTLMNLYADENGIIVQATLTTDAAVDDVYINRCALAAQILMNCSEDEATKLCQSATQSGQAESGGYKIIFNDYHIGRTMIINHSSDEIHTNSLPTLKRPVSSEDISRPTAVENDSDIE